MSDSKTLDTVPSEEATYADQKTFGVVAGRTHVEISPKYGGDFKAGDIIRLEIPAQAYLDPNEFYIHFRTKIFAGTNSEGVNATDANPFVVQTPGALSFPAANRGKTCQFVPGIQSIFNRLRLLAGSVVLEDIQDYNVLYRMLLEATSSKQWRETDGFLNEGVYDPESVEQRRQNANFHSGGVEGHVYTIRPLLGLLAAGKYIPLKYMGQLTLEFYLEESSECLWSTSSTIGDPANITGATAFAGVAAGTTSNHFNHAAYGADPAFGGLPDVNTNTEPERHFGLADSSAVRTNFPNATYQVSDVRMHVPFVHPIESYDQALMRQIEQGDVQIYHSSWSTHTRNISGTSRTSLSFQERALSLKGALCCMRNSPAIREIATDICFPANGISAFQWKIGSEYIPAQEVDCTNGAGRALAELRKGLGIYDDSQVLNNITEESFLPIVLPQQLETGNLSELKRGASQPSNFMMALDLEKSPGQASGFDSAASSVDIELLLTLRNHHAIVPTAVGADNRFKGSSGNPTFQPTKYRVISPLGGRQANPGVGGGYASAQSSGDLGTAHSVAFPEDAGEGIMVTKDLTVNYTASETYNKSNHSYGALNEMGSYARCYFFAHIDQVLRLNALGRMEIVR